MSLSMAANIWPAILLLACNEGKDKLLGVKLHPIYNSFFTALAHTHKEEDDDSPN